MADKGEFHPKPLLSSNYNISNREEGWTWETGFVRLDGRALCKDSGAWKKDKVDFIPALCVWKYWIQSLLTVIIHSLIW